MIALFDMWSNVFASIGSRTTGNDSANYLLAGPKWQGEAPAGMKKVYRSPTRYVWVNGQMLSNGPADYEIVNAMQKQYRLTPLSAWGKPFAPPAEVSVDPATDTKTQPIEQIRKMDAGTFFTRFARLMKDNPPGPEDEPIIEKFRVLGIEPGKDFNISSVPSNIARALNRAMGTFGLLEKGVKKLTTDKGWIVMPKNMGNYGNDYQTRAGIALIGLGAIQPVDISYPTTFSDSSDKPLDAANRYILHFEKTQIPPAKISWSVSMYDPDGFYVPNALNRYHLAAWMPMKYNADGSLDIYIQSASPGADKEANWLPAPSSGLFNLTTRIIWPSEQALNGNWKMPGIKKL